MGEPGMGGEGRYCSLGPMGPRLPFTSDGEGKRTASKRTRSEFYFSILQLCANNCPRHVTQSKVILML